MRVAEIAEKIDKHRNTVNKWINEYSDFFSEQSPNETRNLTDDDLRTIVFINKLVDDGFSKPAILQTLNEKRTKGIALPPVDPQLLAELSGTDEDMGLVTIPAEIEARLEEQEAAIRERDEIIERLSADNDSLHGELRVYQEHYKDAVERNAQLNMTIGQLTERIRSLESTPTDESAQREIQRLKALLAREGEKAARYKDREQQLHEIIGNLNRRLNGNA